MVSSRRVAVKARTTTTEVAHITAAIAVAWAVITMDEAVMAVTRQRIMVGRLMAVMVAITMEVAAQVVAATSADKVAVSANLTSAKEVDIVMEGPVEATIETTDIAVNTVVVVRIGARVAIRAARTTIIIIVK